MTNITKIALGFGVTGITGLSIYEIMKRRKLAQEAFDAEIGEDETDEMTVENDEAFDAEIGEDETDEMTVENDEESSTEYELPEFTKYTGIPVDTVTDMLNAVTQKHYGQGDNFYYYIESKDFESIRESLGVYRMYIRNNYSYGCNEKNIIGEMITFRIRENYCVSNDGWFLISGTWKYLSKDDVLDDYRRCVICKERRFETDACCVI